MRRNIPESACRCSATAFCVHVVALTLTKSADGLVDAKLVLPWLLGALGAPAFFVGLLVPIREAGALLPQLVIAARLLVRLPLQRGRRDRSCRAVRCSAWPARR